MPKCNVLILSVSSQLNDDRIQRAYLNKQALRALVGAIPAVSNGLRGATPG